MTKETRTYRDRARSNIIAVTKRRHKLKDLAIQYKGGRCMFCGYSRCNGALDFHHINKEEKGFALSVRGLTRSWEKIKDELGKCVLVCANCHREVHAGIRIIPPNRRRVSLESSSVL